MFSLDPKTKGANGTLQHFSSMREGETNTLLTEEISREVSLPWQRMTVERLLHR